MYGSVQLKSEETEFLKVGLTRLNNPIMSRIIPVGLQTRTGTGLGFDLEGNQHVKKQ